MNTIGRLAFCISIEPFSIAALRWFFVGFAFALFVTAHMLVPVILRLPRAVRLVSRGEMRGAVFGSILPTLLIWFAQLFVVLFLIGFLKGQLEEVYAQEQGFRGAGQYHKWKNTGRLEVPEGVVSMDAPTMGNQRRQWPSSSNTEHYKY
jgi:hypothetical protein